MKDLQAVRGAGLLRRMVAEGEHERQDFKYSIPDAYKIARSLSAFANNKGGRLLIGVKDNGTIAGVRNEEDIYVVEQAAERCCRPAQKVEFKAYKIEGGSVVIIAEIEKAAVRPVFAGEPDGTWKAYYRVADENIAAHPLMVRAWQRGQRPLSLCDRHTEVLDFISSAEGPVEVRELSLAMHIAMSSAEDIVVDLTSASLLTFVHTSAGFKITKNDGME